MKKYLLIIITLFICGSNVKSDCSAYTPPNANWSSPYTIKTEYEDSKGSHEIVMKGNFRVGLGVKTADFIFNLDGKDYKGSLHMRLYRRDYVASSIKGSYEQDDLGLRISFSVDGRDDGDILYMDRLPLKKGHNVLEKRLVRTVIKRGPTPKTFIEALENPPKMKRIIEEVGKIKITVDM